MSVSEETILEIEDYINTHYRRRSRKDYDCYIEGALVEQDLKIVGSTREGCYKINGLIDDPKVISQFENEITRCKEESFSEALLKIIDEKGLKDSEVYKSVYISKQTFSKIRNANYHPDRDTAILLCIALKLNLSDTNYLLRKLGYTIGTSSRRDLALKTFINYSIYNINDVDLLLRRFKIKPLLKDVK